MADRQSESQEIKETIKTSDEIEKADDVKTVETSEKNESKKVEVADENETIEINEKVTSAYIDRIEEVEDGESKAVIYIDDDESEELPKIILPVSVLPDEIYEGDYILIKIAYDKEKSESK